MIAAIIQARMTSTRLPGKVLKEVMGKPLLGYLVERLHYCRSFDKIILATTVNKDDEPIVSFAKREGLLFYRGSEHDVLDRYYQAASQFNIKHVIRITSDCPLIDPQICDYVVEGYLKSNVDLTHTGPTFAEGVDCEIFSFNALERAWKEAALKSEREHVTVYCHNHPELFKKVTLVNKTADDKYRFTVDEYEDFIVVKAIIEKLYRKESLLTTAEIKSFLDENPSIFKINSHIIRNEGLLISIREDNAVTDTSACSEKSLI